MTQAVKMRKLKKVMTSRKMVKARYMKARKILRRIIQIRLLHQFVSFYES